MNHADLLERSQNLKLTLIEKLTNNGTVIPTDKEGAELLLKALHQLDATTLGDKRLTIDETANESSKQVNDAWLKLMRQGGNNDPFLAQPGDVIPTAPPTVSLSDLPSRPIIEGEGEIGVISETADDFVRRMEQ